jgi:1-acyl-sn-glycerol-3-phosphate acyltransferase
MIVQTLRSIIFYVLFLGHTTLLALILGFVTLFKKGWFPFGAWVANFWANSILFLLRWIIGIRTEVSGLENIPEGGCIIAAKHQSDWDIFVLVPTMDRPAFIAKKELMDIPFFGWSARSMDKITIDRKKGSEAVPAMIVDARAAIARGCRIIIFPEGTRRQPLAEPAYRSGVAKIYAQLDVPVVPVALNSGLFWSRNALTLWPGTAKAKFLPPIPAGLEASEMHKRMIAAIEAGTDELNIESVRKGLSRPITPELRARIDALEEKLGK